MRSHQFLRKVKIQFLAQDFAFKYSWIRRKLRFSLHISYIKMNIINGPNNDFLEHKMVLDLFFDGFSCFSMVYIMQNPKIFDILRIFENIGQKRANFCQKWVPKLKIAISQKHILE